MFAKDAHSVSRDPFDTTSNRCDEELVAAAQNGSNPPPFEELEKLHSHSPHKHGASLTFESESDSKQAPPAFVRNDSASGPQHELQKFICTVVSILGPTADRFLTEIWLDELSSMDQIPNPGSPGWQIVSLGASTRLASRLIASQLQGPYL